MFRILVAHHKPKSMKYGFPRVLVVKNPLASAGDRRPGFDPCVRKVLWRRAWQPTPVFLPGESRGQRSLAATVHTVEKTTTQ